MPLIATRDTCATSASRDTLSITVPLAGTGPLNEPPLRSKPSLHAIQKRQSKVYTREQLQELVQMRATETKMEDISEEHRAAIKKFNEDKASILKCGELSISDLEKQKVGPMCPQGRGVASVSIKVATMPLLMCSLPTHKHT